MDTIPPGYCQCGCGAKTTISQRNKARYGHVKGQPVRYLPGHHNRRGPVDYLVQDMGYATPCWIWQRSTSIGGYGQINIRGRVYRAPRWYYEQAYGPIPAGLHLDHLCRHPACVNPEHLEPVEQFVNNHRSGTTKLSAAQVREIRQATGITDRDLAQRYGVARTTIYNLRHGFSWRKVE